MAGDYGAYFLVDGGEWRDGAGAGVYKISGWANDFRARGGCNLLHTDVRVVWRELVLEGQAEESRRGWWQPVRAAVA